MLLNTRNLVYFYALFDEPTIKINWKSSVIGEKILFSLTTRPLTLLINPNETGWSRFANDLPAGVRDACVVTLDEKSLMLIGGDTKMQNFSTSTFKFGSSFNWETSEPLNIGRRSAGCGIIRFVKSYPMKRGL